MEAGTLSSFERSYAFLDNAPCDILITPHPEVSRLWQRLEQRTSTPDALIDVTACRALAGISRQQLKTRIETEGGR